MKNSTLYIVAILALLVFVVIGYLVIYKPATTINVNPTTPNVNVNINQQQQTTTNNPECRATVTPKTVCSGASVTGTINAKPNVMCAVYMNYNGLGNVLLGNVLTDSAGVYTLTRPLSTPGTYMFSTICGGCSDSDTTTVEFCITPNPGTIVDSNVTDDPYSRPLCSSIINPTSQADCDAGYCAGLHYGCQYYAASLSVAAHCGCI